MANPFAIAGAPATADFELHFVRYRRVDAGRVLAWCTCGWSMCGHRDAVHAASARHDLDAADVAEMGSGTTDENLAHTVDRLVLCGRGIFWLILSGGGFNPEVTKMINSKIRALAPAVRGRMLGTHDVQRGQSSV